MTDIRLKEFSEELTKRNINFSEEQLQTKIDVLKKKHNVIKYGGSIMLEKEMQESFFDDLHLFSRLEIPFVIVHGGGPIINEVMQKYNLEKKFIDGLRVTDETTMKVTEMALSGIVNKDIVNQLLKRNIQAVGISGKDANLISAEKLAHPDHDLGFVGKIKKVNNRILETLTNGKFTSVVSPVARSEEGDTLNINADTAASEIASSLRAGKVVFLTDVEGVLKEGICLHQLTKAEVHKLIEDRVISGGMIPKVQGMLYCLENGVNQVHVIHGLRKHALLEVLFGLDEIGTTIRI